VEISNGTASLIFAEPTGRVQGSLRGRFSEALYALVSGVTGRRAFKDGPHTPPTSI
jgi:hypothetical protein